MLCEHDWTYFCGLELFQYTGCTKQILRATNENDYSCCQGVASRVGEGLGIKVKLVTGGGTKKKMLTPPMSQHDLMVASFGAMSKLTTVGKFIHMPWI